MQWRGPNMQQGLCRSIVWEIMRSHVVDQTHHQPDIIMSTTNIIITSILKIIVIVILTIISTPCFSSRHIRHITMDLLSSNLWKGHGRRHEAIQQCSRSFTKSERTHDRMKPNICTKRSCMMIYICVWQNKMPFLRACKFLSNYMGAMRWLTNHKNITFSESSAGFVGRLRSNVQGKSWNWSWDMNCFSQRRFSISNFFI